MKTIHYINLTNGLLAIDEYNLIDYRFIRIQSTWCEQKRWEDILMTLSDDFLMNLALGNNCIVYDYGARKDVPRAIWQGLKWITIVLRFIWFEYIPISDCDYLGKGGKALTQYLWSEYFKLSNTCKNRIAYYRKFLTGQYNLSCIVGPTGLDGVIPYKDILARAQHA